MTPNLLPSAGRGPTGRAVPSQISRLICPHEIRFLLFDWLKVGELAQRSRFSDHDRATMTAMLDAAEQLASRHFAPAYQKCDRDEPRFDGSKVTLPPETAVAVKAFAEAGFLSAAHDHELGGLQVPYLIDRACMAFVLAANVAVAGFPFLSMANANLLATYGTPAQRERYLRSLLKGRFTGTMCLSEPHAGSSLADIATKAFRQTDGSYRLFGSKMWISGGDHEISETIVHLVLAKAVDNDGVAQGISLFIVPKHVIDANGGIVERNDVALSGLNHKMGFRAITNCALNFGEGCFSPGGKSGAIAELVGEPGQGLAQMFQMMNEARIGVGLGAAALAHTGYRHALAYARERRQGRHRSQPSGPQVAIIEHADVRRMLLAQKAYAEGALALCLYCARLVDDAKTEPTWTDRRRAADLLDLLTPIAKSWPSTWGLAANDLAIQVHGGCGYTRDFPVEQFYRDNRLNPIHEGTHGIQAIDLLGRKIRVNRGRSLQVLQSAVERTCLSASLCDAELSSFSSELTASWTRLQDATASLVGASDQELALANAAIYLDAFGHVVVAWLWLDQVLALSTSHPSTFVQGKRAACRYFFRYELPKSHSQMDLLGALDRTTFDMQDEWF